MKTKYMRIRLTDAEDAIIRENAKQAGGTLTEYIVGVITNVITSPAKSVITKESVITNAPTKVARTIEFTDDSGTTITHNAENGEVLSIIKAGIEKPLPIVDKTATIATDKSEPATTEKLLGTQAADYIDKHGIRVMTKPPIDIKSKDDRIEPTKKVAMDALNKRFEQQMTSAKDTVTTQVKDGRLPKWVVKAERKLMDTTKKELKAIATASTEAAPANIGTLLKAVNQSTCASCSNKIKKGFLCNDCLK